jgi:hypothetical protein
MMKDYAEVDEHIAKNFSKLFAYSRLYNDNGEKSLNHADDDVYEPYVSKESYCQADPAIRRKLSKFALHFDPKLLELIMEWEETESNQNGLSLIQTRARLIVQSAHRRLWGRL